MLQWGLPQAETYESKLAQAIEIIKQSPNIGAEYYKTTHRYTVGSHVILYRIEGDKLHIIRIIHARMNPTQYLDMDS